MTSTRRRREAAQASEPAAKRPRKFSGGSAAAASATAAPKQAQKKSASAAESATATSQLQDSAWFDRYVGVDADYRRYMREEWGFEKRGDQPLFEKLCLEGAQAGLSWATILKKREAYRRAFRGFDVAACAAMSAADEEALLQDDGRTGADAIVRNRAKVKSVVKNAQAVLALQREGATRGGSPPRHGHFDRFLWDFVGGRPRLHQRAAGEACPSKDDVSEEMSRALKERGFSFVGPTICYSLMQSCGLIVDHPAGTPEFEAAKKRLAQRK